MEKRGSFSTRLGFILVSAGCAIGLGNVWRFPYITGQYGGASFVLIYLVFLAILGLPIMVAEFAVGRASVRSAAMSFDVLEPKGTKWHLYKYGAIAGNLLLMAQSGQYNYMRCISHGEEGAAQLAVAEYVKAAMSVAFLLNKKYQPFYKWVPDPLERRERK